MTDADPLEDEVAIVTGASSGIGEATARALARNGAHVTVAARRVDRLETVAEAIVYAVRQEHPNTVNELNYFRQDEIGQIR